jgi:hypothetical protein
MCSDRKIIAAHEASASDDVILANSAMVDKILTLEARLREFEAGLVEQARTSQCAKTAASSIGDLSVANILTILQNEPVDPVHSDRSLRALADQLKVASDAIALQIGVSQRSVIIDMAEAYRGDAAGANDHTSRKALLAWLMSEVRALTLIWLDRVAAHRQR